MCVTCMASQLCAHQQANVCEVWACANICLCKDAHLRRRHSGVPMKSGHACEDLGTCTQEGLCVCVCGLSPQARVGVWVF